MQYVAQIVILLGIYSILALSLDYLIGHLRIFSIAHAAFYGLGAYAAALCATHLTPNLIVCTIAGIALPAVASQIVAGIATRLNEDEIVVTTFVFQMATVAVATHATHITGGLGGIAGIPRPAGLAMAAGGNWRFALVTSITAIGVGLLITAAVRSPIGVAMHTAREDAQLAESMGVNVARVTHFAFALSAGLAGLAGVLYAFFVGYIDPTSFGIGESILIMSMVIIGGAGSTAGPLIGAALLTLTQQALVVAGYGGTIAANWQAIVYGIILVLVLRFSPRGLVNGYDFRD